MHGNDFKDKKEKCKLSDYLPIHTFYKIDTIILL